MRSQIWTLVSFLSVATGETQGSCMIILDVKVQEMQVQSLRDSEVTGCMLAISRQGSMQVLQRADQAVSISRRVLRNSICIPQLFPGGGEDVQHPRAGLSDCEWLRQHLLTPHISLLHRLKNSMHPPCRSPIPYITTRKILSRFVNHLPQCSWILPRQRTR